jgi:hypothetical protein
MPSSTMVTLALLSASSGSSDIVSSIHKVESAGHGPSQKAQITFYMPAFTLSYLATSNYGNLSRFLQLAESLRGGCWYSRRE